MGDTGRTVLAPPAFDYGDYATPVVVSSSIVSTVGVAAHLFIFFSCFRVREEHKTFLLIQQMTSLFAAFGLLTGGLGSVRHEVTDTYTIFLCYGLLKYTDSPRLCAVLDLFPGMHVPLSSVFVIIMMAYRCLGIMGRYFETRCICITVIICVAITLPLPILTAANYVDVSNISSPLPEWLQHEWTTVPSYGVQMTAAMTALFILYNVLSTVSLGFGISTALYSYFAVTSADDTMSNNSLECHQAYFQMLYFEIFTMSIYAVATQFNSSNLVTLPPALNFYLSAFNFVIFALPTVLQGVLMIITVPYVRKNLLKLFTWRSSKVLSVSSNEDPCATYSV